MKETLKFESTITEIVKINPLVSKVLIRIAYDGLNRNNSYISKETFDNAEFSLPRIMILGEYSETIEDFRGHGGRIEITDNEVKWIKTTIPYGFIDVDSEISWQDVLEENGSTRKYICATGYVWTGRYPELDDLIVNSKSQSMEIDVLRSQEKNIDGTKCIEITEFIYTALTILGDDVEPCFESASISSYTLDKDKFKEELNKMIAELKFSLSENKNHSLQQIERDSTNSVVAEVIKEGGNNKVPENILELLAKYGLTEVQLLEKEITYTDFSLEELEVKINENFQKEEVVVEPVTEPVIDATFEVEIVEPVVESSTEIPTEFALTSEQLEGELRRELESVETLTEVYWDEVYTSPRYCFMDSKTDANVVVAYDYKNGYLVGANYQLQGDKVSVDVSTIVRYKADYIPMDLDGSSSMFDLFSQEKSEFMLQAKEKELTKLFEAEKVQIKEEASTEFTKLQSEFATLQQQYSTLESKTNQFESELSERVKQERLDAETSIFESFSVELTEDEMKTIKENASAMSLDEIADKLFSIAGRKKVSFSLKEVKNVPLSYQLPLDIKKTSGKDYDDLFERHLKKEEE